MSAFWRDVAEHPDVKPHMGAGGADVDWWSPLLAHPAVRVFQGEHGGAFLAQLDPLGRIYELHAAFKPDGWGREPARMLREILASVDFDVITASETVGNWRARPPKSFGFRVAGPFSGSYRTWILTRDAWERSPARRRMG